MRPIVIGQSRPSARGWPCYSVLLGLFVMISAAGQATDFSPASGANAAWDGEQDSHSLARPKGKVAPDAGSGGVGRIALLYRKSCARCHGTDGRGSMSRASLPEIPDFSAAAWQCQRSNAQLRATILDGKGYGMPGFADKFDDSTCRDLVAFVRAFGPAQSARESAVEELERRFQELKRELFSLQRQLDELAGLARRP